jgi:putative component of toxin-antitoxin plasmid stabilization module
MRIAYGPGYRVYYLHRGAQIVHLRLGVSRLPEEGN